MLTHILPFYLSSGMLLSTRTTGATIVLEGVMIREDQLSRRIDVLAIGLFGLAVAALMLGVAQLGLIPESDRIGTLVIAIAFGGIV